MEFLRPGSWQGGHRHVATRDLRGSRWRSCQAAARPLGASEQRLSAAETCVLGSPGGIKTKQKPAHTALPRFIFKYPDYLNETLEFPLFNVHESWVTLIQLQSPGSDLADLEWSWRVHSSRRLPVDTDVTCRPHFEKQRPPRRSCTGSPSPTVTVGTRKWLSRVCQGLGEASIISGLCASVLTADASLTLLP